MRIALILLALTAFLFIGSIAYSLFGKTDGLFQKKPTDISTDTPLAIETLKYQIKTEEKLNELSKKIEALSREGINQPIPSHTPVETNNTSSTGNLESPKNVPISAKFLAKVMPTMEFTLAKNTGIYDLHIFDTNIEYSTYTDVKMGTTLIAARIPYDRFLKNMQALGRDVYTVNETKTFPFRSFYVNPPKADAVVRLVFEVESQTLVLSIPKTKFGTFKNLLLKK